MAQTTLRRLAWILLLVLLIGDAIFILVKSVLLLYGLLGWLIPEIVLFPPLFPFSIPSWIELGAWATSLIVFALIAWFFVLRDYPKILRASLSFLSLFVLLFTTAILLEKYTLSSLLSDNSLEETFRRAEDSFGRLLEMSDEDAHIFDIRYNVAFTEYCMIERSSDCEGVLPLARWDEYRDLFRKLGLKYGLFRPQKLPQKVILHMDLRLEVSTARTISYECEKGYAYSERGNLPVVRSLDNINPRPFDLQFKELNGNWYIYHICSPLAPID